MIIDNEKKVHQIDSDSQTLAMAWLSGVHAGSGLPQVKARPWAVKALNKIH